MLSLSPSNPRPQTVTFHFGGKSVGTLSWDDEDRFTFTGETDKSAETFFRCINDIARSRSNAYKKALEKYKGTIDCEGKNGADFTLEQFP